MLKCFVSKYKHYLQHGISIKYNHEQSTYKTKQNMPVQLYLNVPIFALKFKRPCFLDPTFTSSAPNKFCVSSFLVSIPIPDMQTFPWSSAVTFFLITFYNMLASVPLFLFRSLFPLTVIPVRFSVTFHLALRVRSRFSRGFLLIFSLQTARSQTERPTRPGRIRRVRRRN